MGSMYDRILVPTDGSPAAATAVDGALDLASRFDASVHCIHVVQRDEFPTAVAGDASAELARQGETVLEAVADRATETGVDVTTQVIETTGPTHREIVDYAIDHAADLVVMGTQGRTGLDRLLVGSVTERTLRRSPMPVLTVHEDTPVRGDPETVLVPTDGSATANAAADHAIRLAATTGASVHVVHVVDLTAAHGEYESRDIFDALEASGRRAVDSVVHRARETDVSSVEASVMSGTPARGILDYATDRDIDLVVMGTQGRSGLERYLLGSVTEKVVRLADTPILSVAPPEES
jgi:nucleotide-binding universal stress UspA family protein